MNNRKPLAPTPKQIEMMQKAAALHQSGNLDEAATQYKKLLKALPNNTILLTNLGTLALQQGNLEKGVRILGKSLQISPDQPFALNNRGAALRDLKRFKDAVASCDRAIALNPNYAEAYLNRGNALHGLNRLEDAVASYDRAIALNPNYAEAYSNRGCALRDLKRLEDAVASYDRAIALNPNHAEAYWNKSLVKILKGEHEEGWQLFEWRWKKLPLKNFLKKYPQPLWLGKQSLSNKTLLIHPEQGWGDYIQFMRYVALVEQLSVKVILEVPAPLMSIAATLEGQFTLIEEGHSLPDFDYHCPIMSLPLAFKTTLETIPAQIPYLYADKDKQQAWRQKLGEKIKPRVGIVWSGSTVHKNDHNRSVALKQFESLLDLPIDCHCLQKEIRSDDAVFIANNGNIKTHHDSLKDFSDTAALIAEMDLVISVDTSVAHLAGSLGKMAWILLPYVPDYRWMLDRSDCPWYPTVVLFRQSEIGNWDGVINEVKGRLIEKFKT